MKSLPWLSALVRRDSTFHESASTTSPILDGGSHRSASASARGGSPASPAHNPRTHRRAGGPPAYRRNPHRRRHAHGRGDSASTGSTPSRGPSGTTPPRPDRSAARA